MSIKSLFDTQLHKQRAEVARQALQQAFRGQIAASTTMAQLIDEIREDALLWEAFGGMTLGDFRDTLCPKAEPPVGPTRKRGVTSKRIVDHVAKNPGIRRNEIMAALGLKGGTVSSQLRTLRLRGALKVEGEERDYKYFA